MRACACACAYVCVYVYIYVYVYVCACVCGEVPGACGSQYGPLGSRWGWVGRAGGDHDLTATLSRARYKSRYCPPRKSPPQGPAQCMIGVLEPCRRRCGSPHLGATPWDAPRFPAPPRREAFLLIYGTTCRVKLHASDPPNPLSSDPDVLPSCDGGVSTQTCKGAKRFFICEQMELYM